MVTGLGLVCALGDEVETAWRRMLRGEAVSEPIPDHWHDYANYGSRFWAPLPELDYQASGLPPSDRLRFDRVTLNAIAATRQAICDAAMPMRAIGRKLDRFEIEHVDPTRIGVYMGTGIGGVETTLSSHASQILERTRQQLDRLADEAGALVLSGKIRGCAGRMHVPRRFNPLAVTMLMANAISAAPAIRFGMKGPNRTISLACASGTAAIGEAYQAIRRGDVDIAVCGGSEYLYDEYGSIFRAYDITGALTRGFDHATACNRPFDADRNGFLFSAGGAAVLVLESTHHARRRGAPVKAEVLAFAESFDGHNLMAVEPSGAGFQRLIDKALGDARLAPDEIAYINAHGTGTKQNDQVELEVLEALGFNNAVVNSTKGLIGHSIGASGAIEALVTVLSLRDGRTHPCHNLDQPIARLNFAAGETRLAGGPALSNSFAFGGHNCCLVLAKPDSS